MVEPRCIVYIGMDLFPPYNEIQSKTVHTLVSGLPPEQPFRVVSFANPHAKMGPAPDERYIPVPGSGRVGSALGLTATLLREAWFRRSIVHFVMPAHHQAFVGFLIWLCWIRRIPTVFTVVKRKTHALGFRQVTAIVTQTRSAFAHMRALLPDNKVHLVVPGSAETLEPVERDRGKSVLFVGIPWNSRDLERRGVFLFFDVVRETLRRDPDVRFTLLNRALSQTELINRHASELPKENLEVHHGSSNRMSDWYGKHTAFLILHKDDACPDPPLSAIEACCCGCAIVTTRFNGLSKDFSEGRAGVEVEPSAASVTEGILKVLSAPLGFRANAFALGRERYAEAAFCRAYAEIYAAVEGG